MSVYIFLLGDNFLTCNCSYIAYIFFFSLILAGPFELCPSKLSDPAPFFLFIVQVAEGRGGGHYRRSEEFRRGFFEAT